MKRVVWANRSNGQLCLTIPKKSGIKEGDIVKVEKEKIKTIIYSSVATDWFHYGHLKLLKSANELGDFHVCGVLTDESIRSYKEGPLTNIEERMAIISSLRCVDMIMTQNSLDPVQNLKTLYKQFPKSRIILVCGSNWKKVPGADFVKKIGGKTIQFPFYEKLSAKNIVDKMVKMHNKNIEDGSFSHKNQEEKKKELRVYTAGTWDLFHIGHLNILKKSKALGTKLIVGVSTDELVKTYKPKSPVVPYKDRAKIVKHCTYVDKVVKQEKILDIEHLKKLKIDVLTIGDDWKDKHLEGVEWAKKQKNIKMIYLPYTKKVSSTSIKEEIKNGRNQR